ncbi:MAG: SUMF1/EgtB/PvdO family nonheme iron enzyme [Planctomycetales bacterium]|nr:SUMF1/EgtB/PvdO family nonheme iron enzyme [Planctomycetales bacterium]
MIRDSTPTIDQSIAIVRRVGEAIDYAHAKGLVHRDLKPSNILIDARGDAFVTDFGLAMEIDTPAGREGFAGTPAYMSPEQAAGEAHLIDYRSDIFSLGVILYELLTGQRPFAGDRVAQVLDAIRTGSLVSPRQRNPKISRAADNACMRALAPRIADRFNSARDFVGDLYRKTETPGRRESSREKAFVMPKGLRSFDADDADFFVQLLPGPFDANGLPEFLRFWLSQIEKTDESTFRIGLLSGPSGSGKSSFVKAGLIPRLSDSVRSIFVEASTSQTEQTLISAIHERVPETAGLDLVDTFALLRREDSRKTVVFVDQYEQWLQNENIRGSVLMAALRQCDGRRLQYVLLARDEFGMEAARLLLDLDVSIDQGFNFAVVPMLPLGHAREVLRRFGQALDQLPASVDEFSDEQVKFLNAAVRGLAERDAVVPVHLALLTEIMRDRPWTESTLEKIGGSRGVGVVYLDKCFGDQTQHPACRLHARAARRVLGALLPDTKTNIKGHHRTQEELLEVSGYRKSPRQFEDLMRLLDRELRLITSAKPNVDEAEECEPVYILAHDFIVVPLREWLTRQDKQSIRGRAELCLAERSAWWHESGNARHLPSIGEWASIHLFGRGRSWSDSERSMMRRANWSYLLRYGVSAVLIAFAAFGLLRINANQRANVAVAAILNANNDELQSLLPPLNRPNPLVAKKLLALSSDSSLATRKTLNVWLAIVKSGGDVDPEIVATMLDSDVESFADARRQLEGRAPELARYFESYRSASEINPEWQFRATCALAQFAPDSIDATTDPSDVVAHLLTKNVMEIPTWAKLLRPVSSHVAPALRKHFQNDEDKRTQQIATTILGTLLRDDVNELLSLADQCDGEQLAILIPLIAEHKDDVTPKLLQRWKSLFKSPPIQRPGVPIATAERLEASGGLTSDYAFSTAIDPAEVESLSNDLERSGYTETCRIPRNANDDSTMAVIWQKNAASTLHSAAKDRGIKLAPLTSESQRQLLFLFSGGTKTPFSDTFTITDVRYNVPDGRPDHPTDVSWLNNTYWNVVPEPCMAIGNSGGRIDFPTVPFDQFDEFTLEAWLYDWTGPVFGQIGTVKHAGIWFCVGDGGGVANTSGWLGDDESRACELSLGRSRLEGWNHVAIVFDGEHAHCYLNGERVDSTQTPPSQVMKVPLNRRSPVFPAKLSYVNADGVSHWGDGKLRGFRISRIARYHDSFVPSPELECDDFTHLFVGVTREKVDLDPLPPPDDMIADFSLGGLLARRARHLFLNGFTDNGHSAVCEQLHRDDFRPVWFRKDSEREYNASSEPKNWQARWTRFTEAPPGNRAIDRVANLATVLWNLGEQQETLDAFALRENNDLRSRMITHLASANSDPAIVLNHIVDSNNSGIRQALVLALSEFRVQVMSASTRTRAQNELARLFRDGTDPGVHSAIELFFRRWNMPLPQTLSNVAQSESARSWAVTFNDHVMAHVHTPTPVPNSDLDRADFASHFAIATKPVMSEQFAEFVEENNSVPVQNLSAGKPVTNAIWHEAAQYCNWLSDKSGIPETEWCFVPTRENEQLFQPAQGYLQKTGFRLPTVAEWQYACGGGVRTRFHCGNQLRTLPQYCWDVTNSTLQLQTCGLKKPNWCGLFDIHGNVAEWAVSDLDRWHSTRGVACGGDRNQPWNYQEIRSLRQLDRMARDYLIGFRIAQTIVDFDRPHGAKDSVGLSDD